VPDATGALLLGAATLTAMTFVFRAAVVQVRNSVPDHLCSCCCAISSWWGISWCASGVAGGRLHVLVHQTGRPRLRDPSAMHTGVLTLLQHGSCRRAAASDELVAAAVVIDSSLMRS